MITPDQSRCPHELTPHGPMLGLIPARGGSKSIPSKNLALLGGKPLVQHTIETAMKCKCLDRIVMSTDDGEIADVGRSLGIEVPFTRPESLATDYATTLSVQRHALGWLSTNEGYMPEAMVTLQPTSPFRMAQHVDEAIDEYLRKDADSVIGVTPVREHPYGIVGFTNDRMFRVMEFPKPPIPRQDYPPLFHINGALYLTKRSVLLRSENGIGDRVHGYVMDPEFSIDIDTPFDLILAEWLLTHQGR